jgi:hypothetical protein
MLIANQKRKENIAEYLLYMFQVEDLIRAYNFDIELIEQNIIRKYDQPYPVRRDIREWYVSLIRMMKENNTIEKGHIPFINSTIQDLESFHIRLKNNDREGYYREVCARCMTSLETLRTKSGNKTAGDIELSLNGLYGLLMLRLSGKSVNEDTSQAFTQISEMIGLLSAKYLQSEKGEKEF